MDESELESKSESLPECSSKIEAIEGSEFKYKLISFENNRININLIQHTPQVDSNLTNPKSKNKISSIGQVTNIWNWRMIVRKMNIREIKSKILSILQIDDQTIDYFKESDEPMIL